MAISLNSLRPAKGSTHKKKRVGRGPGQAWARLRVGVKKDKSLVPVTHARLVSRAARCLCTSFAKARLYQHLQEEVAGSQSGSARPALSMLMRRSRPSCCISAASSRRLSTTSSCWETVKYPKRFEFRRIVSLRARAKRLKRPVVQLWR